MCLKFIPALFCLFVISDVVMAKPGDVLVEQEGVLHTAKVCVLSNPRSAGSPLTVYCNGELALQVESFEGGFFNNGQKAAIKSLGSNMPYHKPVATAGKTAIGDQGHVFA